MATRTNTVIDSNIDTAIGGTVNASDDVRLTREGPETYDAGLGDWAGTVLASVYHLPPCATNIGIDGTPLELDCADVRILGGHAWAYLSGVATKTIAAMTLGGQRPRALNSVTAATITALYCRGGRNVLSGTANVGTLHAANCTVRLIQGGAKGTLFVVNEGAVATIERDSAALEVTAGGVAILDHADAAIDAVEVFGRGTLQCREALPAALTLHEGAQIDMSEAGQVFGGGTINIRGNIRVRSAPGLGDWTGSATVSNPAGYNITEVGGPSVGAI